MKNLRQKYSAQKNQPHISFPEKDYQEEQGNGPGRKSRARAQITTNLVDVSSKNENDRKISIGYSERKLEEARKTEPSVRKIVRKAAVLADYLTDEDAELDARILRDAAENAIMRVYNNETQKMEVMPDHKTRIAAVTIRRAYCEGTPVKKVAILAGTFADAKEMMQTVASSPEMIEALRLLSDRGIGLEVEGETLDLDDIQQLPEGEHNTGNS